MSVIFYHRPVQKARLLRGEVAGWLAKHKRKDYIIAATLSAPDWVDRNDLLMLRAWARAMSIFHREPYVLDHIVPIRHPRVCGLTVPWNLQVIPGRCNTKKGGHWCPEQLELF